MSAKDAMAAMLDELMGPRRNVELGKNTKVTFDDPAICKYYLVAFCPHDMFVNTKADLGPCPYVHDDHLRAEYPRSREFERRGWEQTFLRFLIKLEEDNRRRIAKNQQKLEQQQSGGMHNEQITKLQEELAQQEALLKKTMDDIEEAGNRGDVSRSMELLDEVEKMEAKKKQINLQIELAKSSQTQEEDGRQKDVCMTCGSMLIRNDAQQRVEEHLTGKMHTGFAKIQGTIKELQERYEQKEKEYNEEREKRREERKRRDNSRDRDRDRKRSRSRDRDRRDRDRHRRSRSRSRSRDRRGNRSDRRHR